jgi:hypothetical protein
MEMTTGPGEKPYMDARKTYCSGKHHTDIFRLMKEDLPGRVLHVVYM